MTQLVEEITIKITLNHCEGDSDVLGGSNDLRVMAVALLEMYLPDLLLNRALHATLKETGVEIDFKNTGLYEVPELGGGDN